MPRTTVAVVIIINVKTSGEVRYLILETYERRFFKLHSFINDCLDSTTNFAAIGMQSHQILKNHQ